VLNSYTLCAAQVWWRAQAAAYIVRPNAPTMAAVMAMRMNASLTHVWQAGLWPAFEPTLPRDLMRHIVCVPGQETSVPNLEIRLFIPKFRLNSLAECVRLMHWPAAARLGPWDP